MVGGGEMGRLENPCPMLAHLHGGKRQRDAAPFVDLGHGLLADGVDERAEQLGLAGLESPFPQKQVRSHAGQA